MRCGACAGKFLGVLQSALECHQEESVMQAAAPVVGLLLQHHARDVLPGFFVDKLCACVGRLLANAKSNNLTASLLSKSKAHADTPRLIQMQLQIDVSMVLYGLGLLTVTSSPLALQQLHVSCLPLPVAALCSLQV